MNLVGRSVPANERQDRKTNLDLNESRIWRVSLVRPTPVGVLRLSTRC